MSIHSFESPSGGKLYSLEDDRLVRILETTRVHGELLGELMVRTSVVEDPRVYEVSASDAAPDLSSSS